MQNEQISIKSIKKPSKKLSNWAYFFAYIGVVRVIFWCFWKLLSALWFFNLLVFSKLAHKTDTDRCFSTFYFIRCYKIISKLIAVFITSPSTYHPSKGLWALPDSLAGGNGCIGIISFRGLIYRDLALCYVLIVWHSEGGLH